MKCPHCGAVLSVTARAVVEEYYAARNAGHRITLKRLAEKHGFNYKYLSSVKVAFDRTVSKP
jgi:hypothetical protein